MTTEIDLLGKVADSKKARTFGTDPEVRKREAERNYLNHKVERALELIDCAYKTLLLQIKASHVRKIETLSELRYHLQSLDGLYEELNQLEGKVKVTTEVD
jgi:hypothetical protein